MKPRLKVYFGKVCAKHPELKGERYLNNRHCVECQLARKRKWHEENREAELARNRKWREENREVRLARKRKWHEENREVQLQLMRKWREENREVHLQLMRKWREENKEHSLAYYREHNAAFKAKHGVCSSTYYRRLKKEQKCAVN